MEKDITLNIPLDEDTDTTLAHAELYIRGDHFESIGKAKRNPIDPPMPVLGEELALARALQDLTAQVMEAAQQKVSDFLVTA